MRQSPAAWHVCSASARAAHSGRNSTGDGGGLQGVAGEHIPTGGKMESRRVRDEVRAKAALPPRVLVVEETALNDPHAGWPPLPPS